VRALLLAAGFGTRLRPMTYTIPKCLVTIKGKPLLEIWLDRLTHAGINNFLINTHFLSEKVVDYINSSEYSSKVCLVYEENLRGTAGTLLDNLNFFKGKDGLFIHADNYCLADFSAFQNAHSMRPKECLLTMMTFRSDNPSSCGVVELDERGVVIGFHEKIINPPTNLANSAIYILSSEFLNLYKEKFNFATDFSTEILALMIGKIYSYETSEMFLDIGTPESYAKANSNF
jgi:mannose-1-phosphate guanylyltransferase